MALKKVVRGTNKLLDILFRSSVLILAIVATWSTYNNQVTLTNIAETQFQIQNMQNYQAVNLLHMGTYLIFLSHEIQHHDSAFIDTKTGAICNKCKTIVENRNRLLEQSQKKDSEISY